MIHPPIAGRPVPRLQAFVLCAVLALPVLAACSERADAAPADIQATREQAVSEASPPASQALPSMDIRLTANGEVGTSELVNLGIPFAQGVLTDAGRVRILDAAGAEVPAFVASTLRWHWADDSIRAVRVQFVADPKAGYRFDIGQPRTRAMDEVPYERGTRPGRMDAPVPRVIATLDPAWLVDSGIAGPQLAHDPKRDYDRYVDRQWAWAKDTPYSSSTGFLFDRASVIGYQYVRSGSPELFAEFYNSATFYLSKIKRSGRGGGWPDCTGGWEFDRANVCDPKYSYVTPHLLLVALAGDTGRLDAQTIAHMADNQILGGWSGPPGPYRGGDQSWTERHAGLALDHLVSAYEITGSDRVRKQIDDMLGWLHAHQQTPPGGDPVTGAWTHSWQAHEGSTYDPATDVRGASPWMGANLVGGLWHAWRVTADPRIPTMLRDFGRYVEAHGFAPDDSAGKWLSSCNAGGTIGWYFSSGTASIDRIEAIQDSEGHGSDSHNPELLMVVAAARHFETDPDWIDRLSRRADLLRQYFNPACAAISHTPRAFNWQHRNPEALWLIEQ
ncbi:hypothetical protein FQY83_09235 [Luteimonas marina]|uniref:Uncharacterized protein n=1 Tax=Luteimonas marina TaxID=488485 RepID=A0A5C5U086_9GAMM|nr:hypothetical protein [Luteimonas marina]TWT19941.1 hypothetical protein FQY83_09235 [Luteimonas marina]